ncbi:RDD family protein [Methanosarcina hadiensis]|uniref:RDD family protein n=1 Tax=Methanosarcina hadiensis TaxID=3078083 RepID=UPI003977519E
MQDYAGFFRRLMASIIDVFIIFLLLSFIQFAFGMREGTFAYILIILLFWLYFACQDSSVIQGTIGKQAMNISITDLKGNRISFARATERLAGKILATLPLFAGFLPVFFNGKRQGIHDKIAKTLVIVRED